MDGSEQPSKSDFSEKDEYEDQASLYAHEKKPQIDHFEHEPKQESHSEQEKEASHLTLRVRSQDGTLTAFKLKQNVPIGKLMNVFCEKQKVSRNAIRFLFEGTRLRETQTPKELGMEDNDYIDAVLEQTGGAFLLLR